MEESRPVATFTDEVVQEARRQQWSVENGGDHLLLVEPSGLAPERPRPLSLSRGSKDSPPAKDRIAAQLRNRGDEGRALADAICPKPPKAGATTRTPKPPVRSSGAPVETARASEPSRWGQFSACFEMVTAEKAGEYLELLFEGQRKVKKRNFQEMTEDMATGAFQGPGTDAIGFDVNGRLVNGQHRLQGVVKTGKSVLFLVVRGLQPQAYDALDTGAKRSMTDALVNRKIPDPAVVGGATSAIYAYLLEGAFKFTNRPSMSRLLNFFDAYPDIAEAPKLARRVYARYKFSPSLTAAMFYLFEKIDPESAESFAMALMSGEGGEGDPAWKMRDLLIRRLATNQNLRHHDLYYSALMVKAYNAFIRRDEVAILRWREVESFPAIFDPTGMLVSVFGESILASA